MMTFKAKIRGLLTLLNKNRGHNNQGRITVHNRKNSCKRAFRLVDFRRNLINEFGILMRVEYDPNRTAFIGLLFYQKQGFFSYILMPEFWKIRSKIGTLLTFPGDKKHHKRFSGFSFPLGTIPLSIAIYNVESRPGSGGCIARAAGTNARIVRKFKKYHKSFIFVGIQLPSGQTMYAFRDCFATLGRVSNSQQHLAKIGLAGTNFYRGIRPHVRGVAMNPIDHPHGGGEGKTSGGRPSVSRWGRLTKGVVTRKPGKIKQKKKLYLKIVKKTIKTQVK